MFFAWATSVHPLTTCASTLPICKMGPTPPSLGGWGRGLIYGEAPGQHAVQQTLEEAR